MSCSRQPENHPHSGICKRFIFLAWMCWSRWHPLNFHFLGVHPRGDGNHLGQLHCRKWATSEKSRLSISTEPGVELLWGQNGKGRWERGAESCEQSQRAAPDLGSKTSVLALLQSTVSALSCRVSPQLFWQEWVLWSDELGDSYISNL